MRMNERGSVMIMILALALILNITLLAFYLSTRQNAGSGRERRRAVVSLNIAEAGKERLYGDLRYNLHRPFKDSCDTVFSDETLSRGRYSVSYCSDSTGDTLRIMSRGTEEDKSSTIEVLAFLVPAIPVVAPPLRAAVSARSNVEISGSIVIDGREHDTSCNLTGDAGVYGVSTCDTLSIEGSARIGGNGKDPVKKQQFDSFRTIVAEENITYNPLFDSPEAVLGLAAGALDEFKFASTKIDSNFRGVRYDTAAFVGPLDLGAMSAGILIVHNGSTTAKLHINNGIFTGLIICDDIEKFNGEVQIRGAVVVLKNSSVIFDGLGNSSICYSSEVLANLTDYCDNIKTVIHELSWREVN